MLSPVHPTTCGLGEALPDAESLFDLEALRTAAKRSSLLAGRPVTSEEEALVADVVQYMEDPKVNPFQGVCPEWPFVSVNISVHPRESARGEAPELVAIP